MQAAHVKELIELEDSYGWQFAKRDHRLSLLHQESPPSGRLVEGGTGSARNLLAFRNVGYEVQGFDVMPEAEDDVRDLGLDVQIHDLATFWLLDSVSWTAVVLLDVIAYISEPVAVLTHVQQAQTQAAGLPVSNLTQWNALPLPAAVMVRGCQKLVPCGLSVVGVFCQ